MRFVWFELMTTNMEAAKNFYGEVVGWGAKDASLPDLRYTLFTTPDASISGLMDLSDEAIRMGARPSWIGYVGPDDVDAATNRFRTLGGTVHVPPTEIPGVSRFSVVADPQLAPLGLLTWRMARKHEPSNPETLGHIGWYELLTTDRDKALAFYGELFGWRGADVADVTGVGPYQLFSDATGRPIGGILTKPPMAPTPFWLFYFNVEDIDLAATRVKAGGGRVLTGPIAGPGNSWIVHCTDPSGAMFAL